MQEKKQKRSIGQCKCCRLHFFDDCGNEELCEHCSLFISDYTKQVRKEVCEEIRDKMKHWEDCLTKEVTEYVIDKETLDKIEKGETKWGNVN